MTHDDGTITTPIPRARQARLADRVRVKVGVAAVEANTDRIRAATLDQIEEHTSDIGVVQARTAVRAIRREGLKRGDLVAESYRIIDRIARGGTAIVYRAEHLGLQRQVALKLLCPPSNARPGNDFERRFILEARTLAELNHPNIVDVFDFGRIEDGRCFLAMELVEGPRLSDLFRDPDVSASDRLDVLIQVCRGILHAHRQGVIHRDIKLSNALVTRRDGCLLVKVLDFGLAKLMDEDDPELTQHGLTLGSPHFMSPEQARGWQLDHRTDIYSLGVLTWCAFTGEYPFTGPSSSATMLQHVVEPVPWLSKAHTVHPVPAGLCSTVRRCMAKDPEDRFGSVSELIAALEDAQQRARRGKVLLNRHGEQPPPPRQVPTRLALLGGLLVSVACLWWQERGLVPPPWTHEARQHGGGVH